MKKRISAALALLLLLTSCGGPVAGDPTPTPFPTGTPSEAPTESPAETPVEPPAETPAAGSPVYTDWSKLEPYEPKTAVYTRRYEGFTDTLIPADDYGPLLSFAGTAITGIEEWEYQSYYYDFYLYGLVTREGEVVLDPVLSSAFYLTESDQWGNQAHKSELMVLGKVFYDEEGQPEERYALCAGDGRWCTDFLYEYNWENYYGSTFDRGVPMVKQGGKLAFLDTHTGEELRELDFASQVDAGEISLSGFEVDPHTGWTTVNLYIWREEDDWGDSFPLLFEPRGNVHSLPDGVRWVERYGDGLVPVGGHFDETEPEYAYRYGYVDADTGEWAVAPVYTWVGSFEDGVAWVSDETGIYLINTAGEILRGSYTATPVQNGDYWYVMQDYQLMSEVLDKDLNRVESPLVGASSCSYLEDGWVSGKVNGEWILVRGEEIRRFPDELGDFADLWGDRILFCRSRGDNETAIITLADLEGNEIARWDKYTWAYLFSDRVTGGCYVSCYSYLEENNWGEFYDLDGNLLPIGRTDYGYLEGGLFYVQGEDATTLTDLEGNVVFRWPIHPTED